jgi:hypothetical protein
MGLLISIGLRVDPYLSPACISPDVPLPEPAVCMSSHSMGVMKVNFALRSGVTFDGVSSGISFFWHGRETLLHVVRGRVVPRQVNAVALLIAVGLHRLVEGAPVTVELEKMLSTLSGWADGSASSVIAWVEPDVGRCSWAGWDARALCSWLPHRIIRRAC